MQRTVRFGDTDAAGVIHFHQLLRWCHEAWEQSLENYGLNALEIFPCNINPKKPLEIALPIIHCQANFNNPIQIGDQLLVKLEPERLDIGSFQVKIKFLRKEVTVATGLLRHRAINSQTRRRCSLPEAIDRWLEASSILQGPHPV